MNTPSEDSSTNHVNKYTLDVNWKDYRQSIDEFNSYNNTIKLPNGETVELLDDKSQEFHFIVNAEHEGTISPIQQVRLNAYSEYPNNKELQELYIREWFKTRSHVKSVLTRLFKIN